MSVHLRFLYYILGSVLFLSLNLQAQNPTIRNYTPSNGLASSETYDVLQDRKGYIWVATDRGISRYNGIAWKSFTTADGLPDNTVLKMYEDYKGRIWFMPISNRLFRFENGKFITHPLAKELARKFKGIPSSVYVDESDNIYCGFVNDGMYKIDSKNKLVDISPVTTQSRGFWFKSINGRLMMGVKTTKDETSELVEFGLENNASFHQQVTSPKANALRVSGTILKNGNALFYFNGHLVLQTSSRLKIIPEHREVICIYEDATGIIWITYRSGGVTCYRSLDNFLKGKYESYFNEHVVSSILQDDQGGYWLTTLNSGVMYTPGFNFRVYEFNGKNLTALSFSKNSNRVLVGFSEGTVLEFDGRKFIPPIGYSNSDSSNHIYSIGINRNGAMICGRSTLLMQNENGFKTLKPRAYSRNLCVHEKRIFGCTYNYFFEVDTDSKMVKYKTRIPVRGEVICMDHNERLWIGDHTGLYRMKDSVLHMAYSGDKALSGRISGISEDLSGRLIISTIGYGLVIMNHDSIEYRYTVKSGLTSNIINSMDVDGNDIWLGTSKGLTLLKKMPSCYKIYNWDSRHGLPGNEIRGVSSEGNNVWLMTQKEVINFNPSKFVYNTNENKLNYVGAVINKKNVIDDSLVLYSADMPVRINFLAVNYRLEKGIQYRYRIKGLYDNWVYTNSNSIEILWLPAGTFELQISSCNENGLWNKKPLIVWLISVPPFYKTWWFTLLLGLVIFVLVWILFRWRIRRARYKNKLEHDLLTFRQQSLALQMNPHFIFNSLNGIQSFVLTENKINAVKYISRFSKLMRLNLDNVRSEFITVAQEKETIDIYLELEQLRFNFQFNYEIVIDETIRPEKIFIPSMIIQPFVENAVLHAFVNLERKGKIVVTLRKDENSLICSVVDNGVGLDPGKGSISGHKSAGIDITIKRIELLNKRHGIEHSFIYFSKQIGNYMDSGTRVEFVIPYKLSE